MELVDLDDEIVKSFSETSIERLFSSAGRVFVNENFASQKIRLIKILWLV